jgi:hypothetical protein
LASPPELRSPFELIDETAAADEVLVLSFSTDLSFFEQIALSHSRALGACVTVISDARMVDDDPVLVRQAGRTYLSGRALCPAGAAFHPKLVVIVGEHESRIAIGSGNLTLAGWHGNAELWTVLRRDAENAPATVAAIADYLRALAHSAIRLGPGCEDALDRVADAIEADLTTTAPGPTLVHNLDRRIIDQLPSGPVDDLLIAAPFYDAGLHALRALCDRLDPGRLEICVEADTSVDGELLQRFADERGAMIKWIDSERYHHGKLVEWRRDGRIAVLSGSPNISVAALMTSVADGGNCELALIDEDATDCRPPLGDPRGTGIGELAYRSGRRSEDKVPIPLGAVVDRDQITISLDRPLDQAARVQRYDVGIDGWTTITDIAAGEDHLAIPRAWAGLSTALRLLLHDGTPTPRIFVTDLRRVTQPVQVAVGRVRMSIAKAFANELEGVLLEDIEELRPQLLSAGALLVPAETDPGSGDEGWEGRARAAPGLTLDDLLAAADPALARPLAEFALALPQIPGMWFDDGDVELETGKKDVPDEGEDEDHEPGLVEVLEASSETQRRRFRRFVERLLGRMSALPMLARTLALRALLHGIRCGIWDRDTAPDQLMRALRALAAPGDEPSSAERAAAGCLLAFALAYLRRDAEPLSNRDERSLRHEEALRLAAGLASPVDPERIALLAPDMPEPLDGPNGPELIQQVVDEVLRPQTGAALAVRRLAEDYGIDAVVSGGAILLEEPLSGQPDPVLLRALGLAREDGPLAVMGTIPPATTAVAVWRAPHLVVERSRPGRSWGRLFKLPEGLTPLNYAAVEADPPPEVAEWIGTEPPALASELLGVMPVVDPL